MRRSICNSCQTTLKAAKDTHFLPLFLRAGLRGAGFPACLVVPFAALGLPWHGCPGSVPARCHQQPLPSLVTAGSVAPLPASAPGRFRGVGLTEHPVPFSEKPSPPWPRSSSHSGLPSSSWSGGGCQLAEAEIAELSNKRCLTFRSEMCLHLIMFLSNVKLLCSGKPWALCP